MARNGDGLFRRDGIWYFKRLTLDRLVTEIDRSVDVFDIR